MIFTETVFVQRTASSVYKNFSSALFAAGNPSDCIKSALSATAAEFGIERISAVLKNPDLTKISEAIQWRADNVDNTENILFASELTNYNAEKFYGNDCQLFYDEHSILIEEFSDALDGRLPKSVLLHSIKADGKYIGYIVFEILSTSHIWCKEETDFIEFAAIQIGQFKKSDYSAPDKNTLAENTRIVLDKTCFPVYVIDRDYNLLYMNEECSKRFPGAKISKKCHIALKGNSMPCTNCPIYKIGTDGKGHVCYCSADIVYDISASTSEWDENDAYVVSIHGHKGAREEISIYEQQTRLAEKYAFIYRNACDYLVDVDLTSGRYRYTHINNDVESGILDEEGDYSEVFNHLTDTFCFDDDKQLLLNKLALDSLKLLVESDVTHSAEGKFRIKLSGREPKYRAYRVFVTSSTNPSVVISFKDVTADVIKRNQELFDRNYLNAAVMAHYPLMVSANLTKNIYSLIKNNQYHIKFNSVGNTFDEYIKFFAGTIHPDDRESYARNVERNRIVYAFTHGDNMLYYEARQKGDDGMYRWIYTRIIRVENPIDDNIRIVFLVRYIDEEKQSEQMLKSALKQAERLSTSKTEFLFRMSNEIRTPLQETINISGSAVSSASPEMMTEALERINGVTRSLLSLINNIYDMTRLENNEITIKKEPFDFGQLIFEIDGIISPQAKLRGQKFTISDESVVGNEYIGDALRVKQIILNLLSNSVKFTKRGGSVSLAVSEQRRAGGNAYIRITVSDTGIGMSEKFLEKLYIPFEKEKAINSVTNEAGLGLHITRRFIGLMGGQINVTSEKNKGTTFDVELRFGLASSDDAEYDFTGYRLLVVEDNEMTSEIISELLESKNARVDVAMNGKEAVEKYRKSPLCYYDAILMDIVMPDMNGYDAARQIRSLDKLDAGIVPIIAMTAEDSSSDIEKSIRAGMNEHLVKPIEPDKLFYAINNLIRKI